MNNDRQMAAAAAAFAERWQGRGYEKGDSQSFWIELLTEVFGVESPASFIRFEEKVKLDNTNFIDAHIPATKVMIEQKSIGKDLRAPIVQSDGSRLTPYQQAKRYAAELPYSERPRWIITCNFAEFLIYDMERPNGEPEHLLLSDLGREYYRLRFLIDTRSEHIKRELQVSIQAGEIVGRIYDALLRQYDDTSARALRWLNILCVRIVFCLYAEDAGIFSHDQFHDYLARYTAPDLRAALLRLFEVLNTPVEQRSRYLSPDLNAFPYTNGGLFAEDIEIPQFTPELRETLLQNASLDFDWSEISPTIFGAVFESTLNPATRRSGGMHYTSIENIHKVIDPLFLDDLRRELDLILEEKVERTRLRKLDAFQDRLASLTFLDPACGSGNFLTETYLSLRRLENEVISRRYYGQTFIALEGQSPVKVSINQFYGIEINDFAVTVATTALWISEAQMLAETERIISHDIDFLPLKSYSNIVEGNALRLDWADVVPPDRLSYIIGNPPFVGARMMDATQKADVLDIFGPRWRNVGNLDYVTCWYKKTADLLTVAPQARAALVSTNSICQGEQVANLWAPLFADGIKINFAHRTFRWDSEASDMAHVHCVIVGFSRRDIAPRLIFDGDRRTEASNINAYLLDAPDAFVGSRQHPICDVPPLLTGSQRIDNDSFMFNDDTKAEFIKVEPKSEVYFRKWYGAEEFINKRPRWVLFLGNCSPSELQSMPHCLEIVKKVRDYRLKSKRQATRRAADYPNHFGLEVLPNGNFMIVPVVSSERRRYVPMGFMSPDIMCSNQVNLIPGATLYHFGVLTSNVHMAWMRAVCGRLKSDYRYSKDVVYNNFPWPEPSAEQRAKIEATAQGILDARALYPDSSLADLYDELTMPVELRRAHQANDRAVMQAYGFPISRDFTESHCVARLFTLYRRLAPEP